MAIAEEQMRERLNHDPRLCDMLIPKWSLGCRRITPGEGYLEAFSLPNCDITNSSITHISESAIHTTDGKVHEIDVRKLITIPPSPSEASFGSFPETRY
jgi:hypothetical protein